MRLGQIGGVDVLVRSSWLLVAALISVLTAPSIDRIAPGLGGLVYVAGLAFAVLLYLSVLLHEVSHALMARAFGFEVRSVTLHFLGGVTEIEGEADTAGREFWISVVGPVTSLVVAGLAWVLSLVAPDGLLLFACLALAYSNLVVGVLNLLPGLPLDGGRVFRSIAWAVTGKQHLSTQIAGWSGRVLAVLALGYPWLLARITGTRAAGFDYALAVIIAFFLWTGASQAIAAARIRTKLPGLRARVLARRVLQVPDNMPLSQAIARAREEDAGGIVVLDRAGSPVAIVDERAVLATPEARRPWMEAGTVARRLEPGLRLGADLSGEDLIHAMQVTPASEYALVEADGSLYGILTAKDVDEAFADGRLGRA